MDRDSVSLLYTNKKAKHQILNICYTKKEGKATCKWINLFYFLLLLPLRGRRRRDLRIRINFFKGFKLKYVPPPRIKTFFSP